MDGKIGVSAAETGKKMVLEGANGPFGRVGAVDSGGDELVVDVLFDEEFLEDGRAFVVEALQLRTKTGSYQCVVYDFESLEDLGSTLGGHGLRVDAVAIVII
jgi:hypothetical protein